MIKLINMYNIMLDIADNFLLFCYENHIIDPKTNCIMEHVNRRAYHKILKQTCEMELSKWNDCFIIRTVRIDKLETPKIPIFDKHTTNVIISCFMNLKNYINIPITHPPEYISSLDEMEGEFIECAIDAYNFIVNNRNQD